jgi:hypothetical protein
MFNANELEEGACQSLDLSVGVQDVLVNMWAMLRLFKTLTNFTFTKFDDLVALVVHTIVTPARPTCGPYNIKTRFKLNF